MVNLAADDVKCGWSNQLLGPLPAWASLTVVGSAAFLLGCLVTALLARCRHSAAYYGDKNGARVADGAAPSPATEWAGGRKATPSTRARQAAVRASGVTGPLGVGVVVQNVAPATPGDSYGMPVAGSRPGAPHPALTMERTEDGTPPLPTAAVLPAADVSLSGGDASAGSAAVRPAYELDELDDEWRALVAEVDDRLVAARAPRCTARERAAVVSALLASAPDEAAEAALDRAARLVRSQRRAGVV